ncbi:unnamed protein product [Brassica napus]|uniref:Uncharacterized protein n=2 Tax=Brassica TaxID=3705 RepID=A0A0D3DRI7_BRAOL|nr:unnamed protein product [Brassica napus]
MYTCTYKIMLYFFSILFKQWHFSKYIFVFPRFLGFPVAIIAAAIDFFHLFFILLRFKCRLHFKIAALSLLN